MSLALTYIKQIKEFKKKHIINKTVLDFITRHGRPRVTWFLPSPTQIFLWVRMKIVKGTMTTSIILNISIKLYQYNHINSIISIQLNHNSLMISIQSYQFNDINSALSI